MDSWIWWSGLGALIAGGAVFAAIKATDWLNDMLTDEDESDEHA